MEPLEIETPPNTTQRRINYRVKCVILFGTSLLIGAIVLIYNRCLWFHSDGCVCKTKSMNIGEKRFSYKSRECVLTHCKDEYVLNDNKCIFIQQNQYVPPNYKCEYDQDFIYGKQIKYAMIETDIPINTPISKVVYECSKNDLGFGYFFQQYDETIHCGWYDSYKSRRDRLGKYYMNATALHDRGALCMPPTYEKDIYRDIDYNCVLPTGPHTLEVYGLMWDGCFIQR